MKKILACVLVKTKVLWILLFLGNLMWQGGTFVAQAQAPYVARAELPVVEDDDPFSVLTVGQLGLLVVMKQNDLFSVRPQRMVYFYDENLKQRWATNLELESSYSFLGYRIEADSVRFVLASIWNRDDLPSFLEVPLCLADGNYRKRPHEVAVEGLEKGSILSFHILPDSWHFLMLNKSRYQYCCLDLQADTLYRTEIGTMRDYDWCDMQLDTVGRQAYFLMRDAKLQEGSFDLERLSFDGSRQEKWTLVSPRKDWRLIDARMALLGGDTLLLGGTWNLDSKRQSVSSYDRGTETAGLFSLLWVKGETKDFWARAYLDFPALDTLMSREEMFKVSQALDQAGGRTILPDYIGLPRLETREGLFSLTVEVYERIVNTTTEVSYDFYGRMMPYTRTEFEGFRYKNAFYAVFDSLGKNRGNSVFDIQHDVRYMNLQPVSAVSQDSSGRLVYGYNAQGIVYYRCVSPFGIGTLQSFKLASAYPGDRVLKTWRDGLAPWYPGCFIAYGYEQVQNTRRKGKSRQCVFYLNKVLVD